MNKFIKSSVIAFTAVVVLGGYAFAEEKSQQKSTEQYQLQQRDMYGWELMTDQERTEHRNKMRSFKTEREREQYRMEHHKMMQQRAEEQGGKLHDMPSTGQGTGMGKGGGGGGKNR